MTTICKNDKTKLQMINSCMTACSYKLNGDIFQNFF